VGATPESVLLLDSPQSGREGTDEGAGAGALFLQVGLVNGVLLRTEVDRVTGQLSDTRTRFLGTKPPKLFAAAVRGERSMLALSSRPWLGYSDQGKFNLVPMSYEALDYAAGGCWRGWGRHGGQCRQACWACTCHNVRHKAVASGQPAAQPGGAAGTAGQAALKGVDVRALLVCCSLAFQLPKGPFILRRPPFPPPPSAGFCSEQVPEGFVAVARNTLRVITLERLGEFFNQQTLRLRYTPRKFVIHPDFKVLAIAEADHAAVPLAQREDLKRQAAAMETDQQDGGAPAAPRGPEMDEETAAREEQWGAPKGEPGQWASCVR
jgi:hypothetical protein